MKLKNIAAALLCGIGFASFANAQNEFYNDGAQITVESGAVIHVEGEVVNDDQGANTGRIFNDGIIQLEGNWSNNSSSNVFQGGDAGTVVFLGNNATQNIQGTNETFFNSVTINKPSGTRELELQLDARADGTLSLTDDFMDTQANRFWVTNTSTGAVTRTLGNTAPFTNVLSGYVTSTGNGRFQRSVTTGNTYLFPTGLTRFRPVEITAVNTNSYGAALVESMPPNNTNLATSLTALNPNFYHELYKTTGTGTNEDITIYHDFTADDICDINTVTIAQQDATGNWQDLATVNSSQQASPTLSSTTKFNYAFGTPFNSEDFALAGLFIGPSTSGCTFPVELIHLTATAKTNSIMLDWATASETNNRGFEVYRSEDGQNFNYIGWKDGVGNSTTVQHYQMEDRNVRKQVVYYYKLHQMDYDGQMTVTNIVQAIILDEGEFFIGNFFPNPTDDLTKIWFTGNEEVEVEFMFYNSIGQRVMDYQTLIGAGYNEITLPTDRLAAGAYHVAIVVGQQQVGRKLIVR